MYIKSRRPIYFGVALLLAIMATGICSADEVNVEYIGKFVGTSIVDVAISGNYAYVAADNNGLLIVDISDPSSLTLVGSCDTAGRAYGVAVSGNYAYVAADTNDLVIVDITNPSIPKIAGTFDIPDGYYRSSAWDVVVSGNYAYMGAAASGLVIVDISNPSSPTLEGIYNTAGVSRVVVVSGNYAYIADDSNGLVVVDISDPSKPNLISIFDTVGRAFSVEVSGIYAYVADRTDGLVIVDVSNPSAPSFVGSYDTPYSASGISILDNYACVADGYNGGLVIVDVSNPVSPTLIGIYDTDYPQNLAVSGNYVYIADYSSLVILRVDRPPVLASINDKSVDENTLLSFSISATDADDDAITYSATGLPSGATLNTTTGSFSWTPAFDQADTYDITFTATANNVSVSEMVTITVVNVDRAPVLASIGAKSANLNELLEFTISATDADGDAIAYSCTGLPAGAIFDATTATFSWTPGSADTGNYAVIFSAIANAHTDSEAIVITVGAVNDWNPWNDPYSEDGESITLSELQEAIYDWRFGITLPTGELVDLGRLQSLIYQWRFGK